MNICVIENGRVLPSRLSIVAPYANVGPFVRGIPVESGQDVDELTVQDFLEGDDSMSCGVQLKACDDVMSPVRPWCFLDAA